MPSSLNADNGVVSGTAGLKSSADSSGVLDLQTNGTTAISISASQVVSFANQPTYTGGTANGVMFLNGSKAVTTGTALTFDGANLGVGTASPGARIDAVTASGDCVVRLGNGTSQARFAVDNDGPYIYALTSGDISLRVFSAIGSQAMTLDASGNLLLGTTGSFSGRLNVVGTGGTGSGSIGYFRDSNATGSNNSLGAIVFGSSPGTDYYIGKKSETTSGFLSFGNANSGAEYARIDSSGNLGVGTTSPASYAKAAFVNASGTALYAGGGTQGVFITGDNSTRYVTYNASGSFAGGHIWQNGNTEVARLDLSGNFGVGTNSPSAKFEVAGTAGNQAPFVRFTATSANATFNWVSTAFASNLAANNNLVHFIGQGGSVNNAAWFGYKHAGAGSASNILTMGLFGVDNVLNVNGNANVSLYGANTSASGVGITFPSTQSASSDANCLDDYEEGTWTPVLTGSSGTATVTYNFRSGVYRKIGSMVYVQFGINIASISGGSGEMVIQGLPFTSLGRGPYQEPASSLQGGNWVTAAYAGQTYMFVGDGSASLYGRYQNNGDNPISISQFQGGAPGTYLNGIMVYCAAN